MIRACRRHASSNGFDRSSPTSLKTWMSEDGGVGPPVKRLSGKRRNHCGRRRYGYFGSNDSQRDQGTQRSQSAATRPPSAPGGGRKSRTDEQPGLVAALEKLVEPDSRGDPQSPLRWTCKSTRALARALQADGFEVSYTKVGQLLKSSGFSLQSNRKTREGADHPDRNAQFEHIAKRVKARQRRGEPALSVDTKKKEVLGNLKNPGKTYRRKRNPVEVNVHDFPDPELGKAIPYGVYDLNHNEAGVSVGITHDTAEFAVEAIRRWWHRLGMKRYQNPRRLLITADSGGSNSSRNRLWKLNFRNSPTRRG